MIKILHIADAHYCPKHLLWVDRAMTHAVGTGIAEGCDLAIIAGDSFDHALSTHEPAFTAFVRQVVHLASEMPVVVLAGTHSHDRPGSLDVLKEIPTPNSIYVADKSGQVIGDHLELMATIWALPSINKADPEVMAMGANAWTHAKLTEFGAYNVAPRVQGVPSILITHGTVTGCTTESGYALVSQDHEFSIENLAAADCDAVMLGHIHRHQSWPNVLTPSGGRTTIAYPGSLARLVHGHMDPVGFLIWDLSPGKPATFEFHESPSRHLFEIDFDGPPDMDQMRDLAAQVRPDDAVRLRWTIDEEHAASVDKQAIRDLFAGAESVKLEPRVLPVTRVRAEGIGKAMTLGDKLGYWARTTGSEQALPRLLERLEMVQVEDAEKIVGMIAG